VLDGRRDALAGGELTVRNTTRDEDYRVTHHLSARQVEAVLAGVLAARR
jgi:aconitate hydratase